MSAATSLMHARARQQELDEWNARLSGQAFTPDPWVRTNALAESGYTPYSGHSQMERARWGLRDGEAPNFIGYGRGRFNRHRRRIKGYSADQYARQMDARDQMHREEMQRFRDSRPERREDPSAVRAARMQRARDAVARQQAERADGPVISANNLRGGNSHVVPEDVREGRRGPFRVAFRRGRVAGYSI